MCACSSDLVLGGCRGRQFHTSVSGLTSLKAALMMTCCMRWRFTKHLHLNMLHNVLVTLLPEAISVKIELKSDLKGSQEGSKSPQEERVYCQGDYSQEPWVMGWDVGNSQHPQGCSDSPHGWVKNPLNLQEGCWGCHHGWVKSLLNPQEGCGDSHHGWVKNPLDLQAGHWGYCHDWVKSPLNPQEDHWGGFEMVLSLHVTRHWWSLHLLLLQQLHLMQKLLLKQQLKRLIQNCRGFLQSMLAMLNYTLLCRGTDAYMQAAGCMES